MRGKVDAALSESGQPAAALSRELDHLLERRAVLPVEARLADEAEGVEGDRVVLGHRLGGPGRECHGSGAVGSPQTCPTCNGSGTIQQAAGKMRFNVPCTRCGGTGKLRTACKNCGGEGRVRRTETIDVRIPAGVASGGRVRVPGKGNAGTMGAPAGDLYLIVEVRPHPFFERRGNDLYTRVPVTVSEATLGAKVEVPTIDGRSIVRIPPGTNSGSTLRLREKGVPSARNGVRGDQYVEIQVVVPKPTDERVRNLMKELETVAPDDPRKDLFAKAGV